MALIGSIAINMKVNVGPLAKGLTATNKALQGFASSAAQSARSVQGAIGQTGSAIAGVVKDFYVKPLVGFGKFLGNWGKAIGGIIDDRVISPFKGFATYLGNWGKALDAVYGDRVRAMAAPLGMMGQATLRAGAAVGRFGVTLTRIGFKAAWAGIRGIGTAAVWITKQVRLAINQLARFAAVTSGIASAGVWKLVKASGDMAEQVNRTDVMFGAFSKDVQAEAQKMAEAFGVSRAEFLASASAFSGIFQAAGYDKKQAADLSTHFVKLATDLSSLANIPVQDAMEKIQSGLAGEVRPLREVGVFMSEDAIKAEAMRMGLQGLGKELTEQQKIQARVSFITRGLAFANGDLARTADSLQNSMRGLSGRVELLAETIGAMLAPVAQAVLGELNTAVSALSLYWEDNANAVVAWGQTSVGAVGETSKSMGWLQKSIGFVADAFQVMKLGFYAAQSYITSGISLIVKGFSGLGHTLDFIVEKLSGYKAGIGDFIDTYGADLDRLSGEQWKKFQTELAKPPTSEGINAYFDKAAQKIKAVRKEAAKAGPDITGIKPAAASAATKLEAPKFASAAALGSKEAANAILRSRYGAGVGKGAQEQTASNTKKTVEVLQKIAAKLGGEIGGAAANPILFAGNF